MKIKIKTTPPLQSQAKQALSRTLIRRHMFLHKLASR
jgi:hypothetical protein